LTPIEYRAALEERLRHREAAAVTLQQRIAQLHVELGVENSAITEIKWMLEQLGDASIEPSVGTTEPAPARTKPGDVQATVLDIIRTWPSFDNAAIAAKVGRPVSQINRIIKSLVAKQKIILMTDGRYQVMGDEPGLPLAGAREDEAA
jgi:hypothetical protein